VTCAGDSVARKARASSSEVSGALSHNTIGFEKRADAQGVISWERHAAGAALHRRPRIVARPCLIDNYLVGYRPAKAPCRDYRRNPMERDKPQRRLPSGEPTTNLPNLNRGRFRR
jgi:hypothetical protein